MRYISAPRHKGLKGPVVYLLHWEGGSLASPVHYVGRTTQARFRERMKEHRIKRDTPTTTGLKDKGATFTLAWAKPAAHPFVERLYQALHEEQLECPICASRREQPNASISSSPASTSASASSVSLPISRHTIRRRTLACSAQPPSPS